MHPPEYFQGCLSIITLSSSTAMSTSRTKHSTISPTSKLRSRSLVEHAQSVLARILNDPDINERRVNRTLTPIYIFASLLLASVILPRLSCMRTWLSDIPHFKLELAFVVLALSFGIWLGLVLLHWTVDKVAIGLRAFTEYDLRGLNREAGVPQTYELVFGGIL
ncbi:hypothetical protein BDZ89DRAFT_1139292 [Hymenopellis radicata]|nr:hypothetical protein BDZ89DRAFT_1139292 [Hymenopellis radicata]